MCFACGVAVLTVMATPLRSAVLSRLALRRKIPSTFLKCSQALSKPGLSLLACGGFSCETILSHQFRVPFGKLFVRGASRAPGFCSFALDQLTIFVHRKSTGEVSRQEVFIHHRQDEAHELG